uniref:Uncharacterized protein n=1 Tax=Trichuris muris TaxID=70415 RepID=A0A5S6QYM7_TRIMR
MTGKCYLSAGTFIAENARYYTTRHPIFPLNRPFRNLSMRHVLEQNALFGQVNFTQRNGYAKIRSARCEGTGVTRAQLEYESQRLPELLLKLAMIDHGSQVPNASPTMCPHLLHGERRTLTDLQMLQTSCSARCFGEVARKHVRNLEKRPNDEEPLRLHPTKATGMHALN